MNASHASLRVLELLRGEAPRVFGRSGGAFPDVLLRSGLPQAVPGDAQGPDPGAWRDPDAWLEVRTAQWIKTHPARKQAGLYLTPPIVARALLTHVARNGFRPRMVLDPAVGAGVFLLEARRCFGTDVAVHGVDLDPAAVALTRIALWIESERSGRSEDPAELAAAVRWGDSIYDPAGWAAARAAGGYDLVCGNPPFGNAIEGRTGRTRAQRHHLRAIFPETARGPFDRCVPFVQLAGGLLSPEGRLALLVPRALLAARYATALRAWLDEQVPLVDLVLFPGDAPVPEAEVAMVGWIATRTGGGERPRTVGVHSAGPVPADARGRRQTQAQLPRAVLRPQSWAGLLEPLAPLLERGAAEHPLLRERFDVRAAATVADSYPLAGALREGGSGWRFLTAGLLDRHHERWGERPARYLGRTLQRPVLPRSTPIVPPGRGRLYAATKIVVAGLAPRLESVLDVDGRYASGVGTQLVLARPGESVSPRVWRRCVILLNSAWLSVVHRARRGPLALAGGSLSVGRRDIEELPFPLILHERAARAPHALRDGLLRDPQADLPRDPAALLDLLDRAALAILSHRDAHERWDALAQRIILRLAGHSERESRAILRAWAAGPLPHAGRNRPRPTAKKLASTAS
jgi:hypothetical protein